MNDSCVVGVSGEPAADSIPTTDPKFSAPSHPRKRKRDSLDSASATEWFDAQVLFPKSAGPRKVVSFSPIGTLLRAHLPLAWLSGTSQDALLPAGTVFQADIPSVTRWDYHILLARLLPNGGLFAIELVELDTFVCHPLQQFVRSEWIERATVGANPPLSLDFLFDTATSSHVRNLSSSSLPSIQITVQNAKQPQYRRGTLARQSILTRNKSLETTESVVFLQKEDADISLDGSMTRKGDVPNAGEEVADDIREVQSLKSPDQLEDLTSRTAGIVSENASHSLHSCEDANAVDAPVNDYKDQLSPEYLRKRYLEMLYLSKTSLAFYAKGPLSRTRARARAPGASMSLESLAAFYRDSIVPIKKLDLKYKDSLKNKIISLQTSFTNVEAPEISDAGNKKPAGAKKSRRMKLGKDALWPVEDEFIEKWWKAREVQHNHSTSMAQEVANSQQQISVLRMREMELQIILILEVLSLETREAPKPQSNNHDGVQSIIKMESTEAASLDILSDAPATKKKPRDLITDLEVLLDKLCILHSVGVDDLAVTAGIAAAGPQESASKNKDLLSDFCKDVVIPFYASKLPEQCRSVCKKLGGLELSPSRPKSTIGKPPVKGVLHNSQLMDHRSAHRRTLQRVLSEEESIRHPSPPVLSRAYTLPTDSLKREPSERPVSRGGMRKSGSFTNREIDLVADAQATAAKKRKLDQIAAQKRELDAAIATLKKPHRTVLAQTFMDDVERRQLGKKAPGQDIDPVQITATPKASRTRPAVVNEYELPPTLGSTNGSGESLIPSSTVKPRGLHHLTGSVRSSAKKRAVLSAIHDTPSRRTRIDPPRMAPCPDTDRGLSRGGGPASPSSSTLVDSTPARPRALASTPVPSGVHLPTALLTPLKRAPPRLEEVFKDAPPIPERANRMMDRVMQSTAPQMETSIYDTLGWNDDYDL